MIDFNNKYVQMGVKASVVAVGLLAVFLLSKTIGEVVSWSKDETYPAKTITVSAEGEALAVADIASFTFSVDEEGVTSEEAQKKSTDKMNAALDYLKQNGVEDKDIKTENYSVYPKYASVAPCYAFDCPAPQSKIVGYTVSQSVRVKVRDTDNAGKFLGELTSKGINNVSGLTFTIDDEDALYAEAREDAIKKAKAKAKTLANNLDVDLGDVISFGEDNATPYPTENYGYGGDMMMQKSAVAPSVPMGENKYTSHVYITYELN
jgi:uncharacterized protein YggE